MSGKHVKFPGRGMHEFYMPTTGEGHKNRRDRRKCEFYNHEAKLCDKLSITCLGPSICNKYSEKSSCKSQKPFVKVGAVVYSKYYGKGVVVSINRDICTVQYNDCKVQCKCKNLKYLLQNNNAE